MIIRPAEERDYEDIYRLNKDSLGYDYDIDKTRRRLRYIIETRVDKIFVAEDSESVCGYIHAGDYECTYSDPLKNLLAIAVDKNCRGRGIGRALLQAAEAWAAEDGSAGIRLSSGISREDAHRFYLSCGYKYRKEQKNFIKIL